MKDLFVNDVPYFIISSVTTIFLALFLDRLAKRIIGRFNLRHQDKIATNQYLYQTIRFVVWLMAIVVILRQIKPLSSLGDTILGATSIIAVAVGIAAQATFGNYIAGFFLAVHQPFKVGDIIFIKERGLTGTVKEINFRHTVLLTQEQTEIIVPNTVMNTVVIEDMSKGNYSEVIELKVAGKTDLKKLEKMIEKILGEEELVDHNFPMKLIIRNINKDGYEVCFPVHTDNLIDYGIVRNSILPKLYKQLNKDKIELL